MTAATNIQTIVEYTNSRLQNWYKNAKLDYGVEGSALAVYSPEHESIIITAIEDGQPLEVCKVSYVLQESRDYAFNVWSESL